MLSDLWSRQLDPAAKSIEINDASGSVISLRGYTADEVVAILKQLGNSSDAVRYHPSN